MPSVGLLNDYHEPPLFLSVERHEYHNKIIPTTWFGNGFSLYGKYLGLKYNINIIEGLNADKFSPSNGIRGGRQKGFNANADNLLYNLGVDYIQAADLLIGGSFTYNNAFSDSINNKIVILEGHIKYNPQGLIIIAEYSQINFEKGKVKTSAGFYIDLGYNISRIMGYSTKIIPFLRYTSYNTASSIRTTEIHEYAYNVSKFMFGISVKPIDEVVFKFDISHKIFSEDKIKSNLINLGIGYMF